MGKIKNKFKPAILYAIIAGCVISFVSFGFSASFSVFLRPMSADLGWGREVFSLSLAIQALMWGITQRKRRARAGCLKTGMLRIR
jgi:hypothetical protein